MAESLLTRVEQTARQARRLQGAFAALAASAAIVLALLLLGLGDWLVRPLLWPGRFLFSLLAVLAITAVVWKFVWPLFLQGERFAPVQTARSIERFFPQLSERLSAAVAFLLEEATDSPALRRSVVAETEALATGCHFDAALDRRPLRRAVFVAALVLLVALGFVAASPLSALTAVARLALPWGGPKWPPRHQLEFVQAPRAIPYGGDLNLEVLDRNGRLPERVEIWLRSSSGEVRKQPLKLLRDRMVFHLAQLTQPLDYRVQGGDDLLQPWISLAVVQPPKLVDLELQLEPPAYLQSPPEKSGPIARVVGGSAVVVRGKVDRPIGGAKLSPITQEAAPSSSKSAGVETTAAPPAVEISTDGLSFRFPPEKGPAWRPEQSGAWKIELSSADGAVQVREGTIELTLFADQPPALAWETPADQAVATPTALAPIRVVAKDDLALSAVELRFAVIGSEPAVEQIVQLWKRPAAAPLVAGGQSLVLDYAWDLAAISPPLEAGQSLAVRIVARDQLPQESDGGLRRLQIVNPATLEQRLAQQQAAVLDRLLEVLRIQRVARDQTGELARRLGEGAQLAAAEIDILHSAELQQRQVEQLLSDQDGVSRQLTELLAQLAANRLEGQPMAERLRALQQQVAELRSGPLAGLSEQLGSLAKDFREQIPPGNLLTQKQSLSAITAQQDRAITQLEALLGDLGQWDNFSRIGRELGQIRLQQEALRRQSDELRLQLAVAGTTEEQTAARTAARSLAAKELDLARELDKLLARASTLLERMLTADPGLSGRLALMLEAAYRLGPAGAMRTAAQELQAARLSEAVVQQASASDSLAQLIDLLQDKAVHDPRQRGEALRAGLHDLNRLFEQMRSLADQASAAAQEPAPADQQLKLQRLAPELAQAAQQVEQLARRLQRLRAVPAAQAAAKARASAADAAQNAQAGGAKTADEAQQALAQLQEARKQLAQAVQQAEEDLVREQLARLDAAVSGLSARQSSLLGETKRLETLRGEQGELTAPQGETLAELGLEQESLVGELARLRAQLDKLATFELVLTGIEREMTAAAAQLRRGVTGAAAQTPQERILQRLAILKQALQSGDQAPPAEGPEQPPPEGQPQPQGEPPQIRGLAELELALLLQQDINRRTAEIAASRLPDGSFTPEQQAELQLLAGEQSRLAQLVLDLVPPADGSEPRQAEPPAKPSLEPPPAKKPAGNALDDELLKDLLPKEPKR